MRADYLIMFDGEESGRVFYTNTAAVNSFGTIMELNNLMVKDATAMRSNIRIDWERLSIVRSKLLTLWVTVVAVDGYGLHGFVRNGTEYNCFADTNSFCELIKKRVHAEIMHCRKLESSRLSKRRAKEARAMDQLNVAIQVMI